MFSLLSQENYGAECAISSRPFTVFRWRPGNEARYKRTVVCREIALAKNVCQVCLLDLDYGIPVQARDAALGREREAGEPPSTTGHLTKPQTGTTFSHPQTETGLTLYTADPLLSFSKPRGSLTVIRVLPSCEA